MKKLYRTEPYQWRDYGGGKPADGDCHWGAVFEGRVAADEAASEFDGGYLCDVFLADDLDVEIALRGEKYYGSPTHPRVVAAKLRIAADPDNF